MSDFAALAAKYRPVFERIAEGARERELGRVLPFEQIRWLKEAGFTGLRVPTEYGGDGASLRDLFRLLVELAAADSHIPQAFRGHIAFVEDRLAAEASRNRDAWLRRFAAGELVGNAVTEVGSVELGRTRTALTAQGGDFTITGQKFYTTGSIFAEWIDTFACDPEGREVAALVSTSDPGVEVSDDWTGFGQRLTGSGTATFTQARVAADHVYAFDARFPHQTALYQLVLTAVHAGIARAAETEAMLQVQHRARTFSHGNAARTREDPQILEMVGRISADAFAAEAIVLRVADEMQEAMDRASESMDVDREASRRAVELASARAQITVQELSLRAATQLFDALGASATSTSAALDRHWRNARTVASHNPAAFKARIVGDAIVNGAEPPYEWTIGVPPAS